MQIDCGLYRNILSEFSAVSSYKIFKSSGVVSPQFHLFQGRILCEHIILYPVIRNIRSFIQNSHFIVHKTRKSLIKLSFRIETTFNMDCFSDRINYGGNMRYIWIVVL